MSTTKEKIAIFHNLPPGGAKRYIYEISKRLKHKYVLHEYTISTSSSYLPLKKIVTISNSYKYQQGKNIFEFVFNALFKLKSLHKTIAADIDSVGYKCVLVNQ